MKSKAVAKYVKISPRKVRLIMDQIRGKKVEEAFNLLTFAHQRGAFMVKKLEINTLTEKFLLNIL